MRSVINKLKEHEGFKPGMVVYLKSDLSAKVPLVIKTIQVVKKTDSMPDMSEFGIFNQDKTGDEVEIVVLRATSQKNIVVDFLPPEVICTDPKK